MKIFIFLLIIFMPINAFAANITANGRALDEYGNWKPIEVDSNGYLIIVGA